MHTHWKYSDIHTILYIGDIDRHTHIPHILIWIHFIGFYYNQKCNAPEIVGAIATTSQSKMLRICWLNF